MDPLPRKMYMKAIHMAFSPNSQTLWSTEDVKNLSVKGHDTSEVMTLLLKVLKFSGEVESGSFGKLTTAEGTMKIFTKDLK